MTETAKLIKDMGIAERRPGEFDPWWGIYDTVDNVWLGDERDEGPALFGFEEIARISAQMADMQLGQPPGRCRTRKFPPEDLKRLRLRDRKPARMSSEEALRRLEEGRFE